jgi:hypothetical protein
MKNRTSISMEGEHMHRYGTLDTGCGECLRRHLQEADAFLVHSMMARPNIRERHEKHSCLARMPVPKMVKNGHKSSFVFSDLIWACLVGEF